MITVFFVISKTKAKEGARIPAERIEESLPGLNGARAGVRSKEVFRNGLRLSDKERNSIFN